MVKISISCPHCTKRFKVDETNIGRETKCSSCGARFILRPESPKLEPVPTAPDTTFGGNQGRICGEVASTGSPPSRTHSAPEGNRCLACGGVLPTRDLVCMSCGFNRVTNRQARTIVDIEDSKRARASGSALDAVAIDTIRDIARHQRHLILAVLCNIVVLILGMAVFAPFMYLSFFVCIVASVFMVMLMRAMAFNVVLVCFLVLLVQVPVFGLLVLVIVNRRATSRLQRVGI